MISKITQNALQMLLESKVMSESEIASLIGMPVQDLQRFRQGEESLLTMEHVDRLSDFFGPGFFEENFVSQSVFPSGHAYRAVERTYGYNKTTELHRTMCCDGRGVHTSELMAYKAYIASAQSMVSAINDVIAEKANA
jgi:hypothetical protein